MGGYAGAMVGALASAAKSGKGKGDDTSDTKISTVPYEPSRIDIPSYKKGGRVRKTGLAKLHRGERVLNKRQEKRYEKSAGGKR